MNPRFEKTQKSNPEEALDSVIAVWKAAPRPERLSDETRRSILRETLENLDGQPVATGLRSAAWRILAGALPVAAIGLLAVMLVDRGVEPTHPLRVRATKAGGEVIFSIANGNRDHSVYKSSVPNRFGASAQLQVRGGSFRDTVDDDSGLVFYRIE